MRSPDAYHQGDPNQLKALHLSTASLHRLANSPGSKFNRHGGSILNRRQHVSVLVAKTAYDKGHGWQADEVSVREMIEDDIAWRTDRVGKEERAIRDVAALEYMKRELLREIVADFAP